MDSRSITHLSLRQFKSVEQCEIELSPLTILVGRNGVGKSNLIDALRFVADSLRHTLEFAIRERGGIDLVRRKSLGGRPTNPAIGLRIRLPDGATAIYAFKLAAVAGGGFRIDQEHCRVCDASGNTRHQFEVNGHGGTGAPASAHWSLRVPAPAAAPDRLFLVAASGLPEFRPVFDALTRMTFHNLNPSVMKYPQRPEPGRLLSHDGRNIAGVIRHLQDRPQALERVVEYLRAIGVAVTKIEHKPAGPLETIQVAQEVRVPEGMRNSNFDAISLSDGTMRALGILVSVFSSHGPDGPTLIGIEEPETALHPAAAGALMEALVEGASQTQLILTCHSPELVDHQDVTADMIRPVINDNGRTVVGRMNPAKADLLKQHLATAGELLRLDQLEPDPEDLKRQAEGHGTLFEALT